MSAYLIDLDGTFFFYGTNKLTPRGAEIAKALNQRGDKIYFVTARKEINEPVHLNLSQTHLELKKLGIQYELVIGDMPSPRILINDEGATAYNIETNTSLAQPISLDITAHSIHCALAGLTWVNSKFGEPGDADDYVQTILIAESLIKNSGFNHLDIVSKFRAAPPILMRNCKLEPGGISAKGLGTQKNINYKGQISKLILSNDPYYKAKDGVSDGAAMRTLGIGAYFANDFKDLVFAAYEIAAITHGSSEARLSAVLTALRYRQIFVQDIFASPSSLYAQIVEASRMLGLGESANFFLKRAKTAASIATKFNNPAKQLLLLARFIGIDHLCWSTPIAATFWSFHSEENYKNWFKGFNYKNIQIPGSTIPKRNPILVNAKTYLESQREEDVKHLKYINEYEEFINCHDYHYGKWIDIDTFFSIAISMLSGKNGVRMLYLELDEHLKTFNVDIGMLAKAFAENLAGNPDCANSENHYNFYT
uniref:ADP-ribosylglycohydrolase family protein n=1 Tax=Synechococcus sp. UW106 TaxID=368495 RepID=UPI000E0E32DC|nr:ADP-ribosylglycohydrolase family protein [Synechococcus sp. UW106]